MICCLFSASIESVHHENTFSSQKKVRLYTAFMNDDTEALAAIQRCGVDIEFVCRKYLGVHPMFAVFYHSSSKIFQYLIDTRQKEVLLTSECDFINEDGSFNSNHNNKSSLLTAFLKVCDTSMLNTFKNYIRYRYSLNTPEIKERFQEYLMRKIYYYGQYQTAVAEELPQTLTSIFFWAKRKDKITYIAERYVSDPIKIQHTCPLMACSAILFCNNSELFEQFLHVHPDMITKTFRCKLIYKYFFTRGEVTTKYEVNDFEDNDSNIFHLLFQYGHIDQLDQLLSCCNYSSDTIINNIETALRTFHNISTFTQINDSSHVEQCQKLDNSQEFLCCFNIFPNPPAYQQIKNQVQIHERLTSIIKNCKKTWYSSIFPRSIQTILFSSHTKVE